MTRHDPLHVAARHVLLDALEAVAAFRRSLIIVGAQAVYLRTEAASLDLPAFTTDGDIAIDPSSLPKTPPLEATLAEAGFTRATQPGSWTRSVTIDGRTIDVSIDFMVPEAVAPGSGRRSVELEGHNRHATRRVHGLEAALIDHGPVRVAAIEAADSRAVTALVAGPAALMIAKLHKIAERVESDRHRRTPVDRRAPSRGVELASRDGGGVGMMSGDDVVLDFVSGGVPRTPAAAPQRVSLPPTRDWTRLASWQREQRVLRSTAPGPRIACVPIEGEPLRTTGTANPWRSEMQHPSPRRRRP
jgi:hypothetical protein